MNGSAPLDNRVEWKKTFFQNRKKYSYKFLTNTLKLQKNWFWRVYLFRGLATPQIFLAGAKLPQNVITHKSLIVETWFLAQNLQNSHVSICAKKFLSISTTKKLFSIIQFLQLFTWKIIKSFGFSIYLVFYNSIFQYFDVLILKLYSVYWNKQKWRSDIVKKLSKFFIVAPPLLVVGRVHLGYTAHKMLSVGKNILLLKFSYVDATNDVADEIYDR